MKDSIFKFFYKFELIFKFPKIPKWEKGWSFPEYYLTKEKLQKRKNKIFVE